MSIRGSKGVKLYHNGELYNEMESVKVAIDFLVLHDPKQRSWGAVRGLFKKARRNGTSLFGFSFAEDPNWIPSRMVMATDIETNETFVKDSVGEMGRLVFGPDDYRAVKKITELCRNGRIYKGLTFRYVDENDGYLAGYGSAGDNRKSVQQLDIDTGDIINDFSSITKAAQFVWRAGQSNAVGVGVIILNLSSCVNGAPRFNGIYLGYRWQFTNYK